MECSARSYEGLLAERLRREKELFCLCPFSGFNSLITLVWCLLIHKLADRCLAGVFLRIPLLFRESEESREGRKVLIWGMAINKDGFGTTNKRNPKQ